MAERFRMYFLKRKPIHKKYLIALFICVNIFVVQKIVAKTNNEDLSKNNQWPQYENLQIDVNNFYSSTNEVFSIPNFLYGEPLLQPQPNESYERMIDRFFLTYSNSFQNITIEDFRVGIEQPKDRTITQVHLFQTYQGISVFGAEVIMTFDDKHELISYLGKYLPHLEINSKPNNTIVEIQNIVAQDLKSEAVNEQPNLIVFNRGVLTDQPDTTHLAWRLATHSWVYFVDAHTNEIIIHT